MGHGVPPVEGGIASRMKGALTLEGALPLFLAAMRGRLYLVRP